MRIVERPEVFLIQQPSLDWDEIQRYLKKVGDRTGTDCLSWAERAMENEFLPDGEALVEFMGRFCYRSWVVGANANVSMIREDSKAYFANILSSGHGSVTEHANYTFVFDDVSRVFTHEVVRHRAGAAHSQESMRFVRLTDMPFWFPEWCRDDAALMTHATDLLKKMEEFQRWVSIHFELDERITCPICKGAGGLSQPCARCMGAGEVPKHPFSELKAKTSFMRRFAPDGVATGIGCTFNIRTIRHIVYMRTALSAEEEIRLVMDDVARLALNATPNLMQDYSPNEDKEWIPEFLKV